MAKKIAICGILAAVAMVISLLERLIPMNFILPGLKLGLANIVTLYAVLKIGKFEAFMIFLTRILIVSILSGRISSLMFSFLGATFAWVIVCVLSKFVDKGISVVGISIAGAAFHNIGQIIAGVITISSLSVLIYLPYLLLLSIPIGFLTGMFLQLFMLKTKRIYNK